MVRRLLFSLLIGLVLVMFSLFYKAGPANLEPMPYVGSGLGTIGCPCGSVAQITTHPGLAKRGLPLPIVAISKDEDRPNNYYRAILVSNLVIDLVIYTTVSFGTLSLYSVMKHKKLSTRNP
jgi:hypothetical protein